MIKPLLFGYLRAMTGTPPSADIDVGVLRTAIRRFAIREGFALSQVFVETRTRPPWTALDSLLEATRFTRITAVVVFDRTHLGADSHSQAVTRDLIQTTADCPVITMRPTTTPVQRPAQG